MRSPRHFGVGGKVVVDRSEEHSPLELTQSWTGDSFVVHEMYPEVVPFLVVLHPSESGISHRLMSAEALTLNMTERITELSDWGHFLLDPPLEEFGVRQPEIPNPEPEECEFVNHVSRVALREELLIELMLSQSIPDRLVGHDPSWSVRLDRTPLKRETIHFSSAVVVFRDRLAT